MTAQCSRCGQCCNPVPFTRAEHEVTVAWSGPAMEAAGTPDPRTDDGWAWWMEYGRDPGERDKAIARTDPDGRWREDADFIAAHWTPREDGCTCDMFDPATNLCTAQDGKPPVCRDYPWYSAGTRHACCLGVRTSPTSSRRTGPMAAAR